ncbi:unnamed protein product [Prorocentrum cordatum]|uniref:DNA (cytosine-5-)-methyltransferase n=1 Tax=Prorocentrum cordatum TaxID=2364126 RepID=A0ABN9PRX6_9DINO|nr:unnamed protein product [Polarella glacialis]
MGRLGPECGFALLPEEAQVRVSVVSAAAPNLRFASPPERSDEGLVCAAAAPRDSDCEQVYSGRLRRQPVRPETRMLTEDALTLVDLHPGPRPASRRLTGQPTATPRPAPPPAARRKRVGELGRRQTCYAEGLECDDSFLVQGAATEQTYKQRADHIRRFKDFGGLGGWTMPDDKDLDSPVMAHLEGRFLEGANSHAGIHLIAVLDAFHPRPPRAGAVTCGLAVRMLQRGLKIMGPWCIVRARLCLRPGESSESRGSDYFPLAGRSSPQRSVLARPREFGMPAKTRDFDDSVARGVDELQRMTKNFVEWRWPGTTRRGTSSARTSPRRSAWPPPRWGWMTSTRTLRGASGPRWTAPSDVGSSPKCRGEGGKAHRSAPRYEKGGTGDKGASEAKPDSPREDAAVLDRPRGDLGRPRAQPLVMLDLFAGVGLVAVSFESLGHTLVPFDIKNGAHVDISDVKMLSFLFCQFRQGSSDCVMLAPP